MILLTIILVVSIDIFEANSINRGLIDTYEFSNGTKGECTADKNTFVGTPVDEPCVNFNLSIRRNSRSKMVFTYY